MVPTTRSNRRARIESSKPHEWRTRRLGTPYAIPGASDSPDADRNLILSLALGTGRELHVVPADCTTTGEN